MMISRRTLLHLLGLTPIAAPGLLSASQLRQRKEEILKPPRLKRGDTIALVNPAGATFRGIDVDIVTERMAALGLKVKQGRHIFDRYGYLAGRDKDRADDVNRQFADSSVAAILAVRGGWGCARLLPFINYKTISRNPKVFLGYSDITALHMAVSCRTGLVTFHGPVGISSWNDFTVSHLKRILFEGQAPMLENLKEIADELAQTENRVQTIHPGRARGRLLGGNLTVLSAIIGSGYLPDWKGAILFLEDIGEEIYRIDRMLTQLKLAGVLDQLAGFVFGNCTDCDPGEGYGSLTLEEVLDDHIRPLRIPAWQGAMIGHIRQQFTVPQGIPAEIDSVAGTIRLLEPAVT